MTLPRSTLTRHTAAHERGGARLGMGGGVRRPAHRLGGHPGGYDSEIRLWRVSARDLRGAPREYQPWEEAVGADEATALHVLAERFRASTGDETA